MRGRGRGRGRGGFGGGGGPSMEGALLMHAPAEVDQLYPKKFDVGGSTLAEPDTREEEILKQTKKLDKILADGLANTNGAHRWAGWRVPDPRKVVSIEIDDLNARPPPRSAYDPATGLLLQPSALGGGRGFSSAGAGAGASGSASMTDGVPFELHAEHLGLDPSFFPPALWEAYFDPEKAMAAKGKGRLVDTKKRKRAKIDVDDIEGGDVSSEDDHDSNASSGMRDDDFDDGRKTDDEDPEDNDDAADQDHQDYDANYFDNGEGDDDDDAGGGGD